jgi:polar amino acid transport system substrate-binding protein
MNKVVLVMMAALVVGACGSSSTTSTSSTSAGPGKVASIASEVPDLHSQAACTPGATTGPICLQIATDATYLPNEGIDPNSGAIIGWDIDLGNALCAVMGVKCTFNNVIFADIIPQLKASTPRYQFSISSWSPTSDREASGIDFITYYKAGESWLELTKSGAPTINGAADMCGKHVAVEAGTTEESDAWGYMGKQVGGAPISGDTNNCMKAGKPDITVDSFQTQTDANSALLSGRDDFGWLDQPVADYQVKQLGGKVKIGGTPCSIAPYGIALPKGSGLEKPLQDALKYLMDHNYYKNILTSWNVTDGAITSADVGLNVNSLPNQPSCVPSY